MIGDAIYPPNAMLFGPDFYEVILEMSPFFSVFSGVPCHHMNYFSRPRIVLGGGMVHGFPAIQ